MTSLSPAPCLSFLTTRSSARWEFRAPTARNARRRQLMPSSKEENEKSKLDRFAGSHDRAWYGIAGVFASFTCHVRSHQGRYGHGNRDAVAASESTRISLYRHQE